jgi:hypothetical protein
MKLSGRPLSGMSFRRVVGRFVNNKNQESRTCHGVTGYIFFERKNSRGG